MNKKDNMVIGFLQNLKKEMTDKRDDYLEAMEELKEFEEKINELDIAIKILEESDKEK